MDALNIWGLKLMNEIYKVTDSKNFRFLVYNHMPNYVNIPLQIGWHDVSILTKR